jgi:hypothetical protein
VSETPETEAPEETALYRIFGGMRRGRLLYIGISKDFGKRWKQEAATFPWWDEKRRMTVHWYDSRPEAAAAERAAIKAEYPKYNKKHAVARPGPLYVIPVAPAPRPLAVAAQVAAYLKVPESELKAWYRQGDAGPRWVRIGRTPMYRWDDVEDWLAEHPEGVPQLAPRVRQKAAPRPRRQSASVVRGGEFELQTILLSALEDVITGRPGSGEGNPDSAVYAAFAASLQGVAA